MPNDIMIFRFSDVTEPRLDIALYHNRLLCREESFSEVDNFSRRGTAALAKRIKEAFGKITNFDLVISSSVTFKWTADVPPINKLRAKSLMKKRLFSDFPDWKKKFYPILFEFVHPAGYSFDCYFIKRDLVDRFKRLAAALGVKCLSYNIAARYLLFNLNVAEPFSALFFKDNDAVFFCADNGKLLAAVDMPYEKNKFVGVRTLVESGCERRLEIDGFKKFYALTDGELPFVDAERLSPDLSTYKNNGIKL